MARTVTLAQLRLRSLRRADMVTSGFVSNTEVNDVINDELCELYDLLVEAAPPDYYSAEATVTTASGTLGYALANVASDFRSLIAVYADEGSTQRTPILAVNEFERANYRAPQGIYSIIVRYCPAAPVLANDNTTFDGVSGWDSLVTARVARRLLAKRKADTGELLQEIGVKTQQIQSSSRRDRGQPRHITDVDQAGGWYPSSVRVRGYALIGGNLELYEPAVCSWP